MSPNGELIRQWREEYARRMLQLDFEPMQDSSFHCSNVNIVDGMRILRSSFSPGLTIRDDELVKNSDDSFAFLISRTKQILLDKKLQDYQLGHGDAAFLRVCEPGRLGSKTDFTYVAMIIPNAELESRVPNAGNVLRKRVSKTSEGLQLMRSYVRALESGKRVTSPSSCSTVQRHLFDLAALTLEADTRLGESNLSAVATARRYAAEEIIKSRFEEPDISVATVANALSVSARYLQRLFQLSDTTFTAYVNNLRLDRAFELLSDAQWSSTRISDIALRVGFSDISYFDRSFKQRFGAAPSDIRRHPPAARPQPPH